MGDRMDDTYGDAKTLGVEDMFTRRKEAGLKGYNSWMVNVGD